jgi:hypothetical protein
MPKTRIKDARANLIRVRVKNILDNGGFKPGDVGRLATELSVSKQYVSLIKTQLENPYFKPREAGKRIPVKPFSAFEEAAFLFVLRGRPPVKGVPHKRILPTDILPIPGTSTDPKTLPTPEIPGKNLPSGN